MEQAGGTLVSSGEIPDSGKRNQAGLAFFYC
jgi:hypothetical protein